MMKIGDPEMNWIGSDEYKHRVLKKNLNLICLIIKNLRM